MVTLDCTGLLCPVPIYLTAQRLARLPAGAQLAVIADDAVITQDLPSWCRLTGHTIVKHRQVGGCHRYVVKKNSESETCPDRKQ